MGSGRRPAARASVPLVGLVAGLCLVLAGCAGNSGQGRQVSFVCPEGTVLLATFYPDDDLVRLRVNGQDYELPRQISVFGARYGAGETVFWNKGREALLDRADGPPLVGCLAAS